MSKGGEELRRLREEAGYSLERLSTESGVNKWAIMRYELGKNELGADKWRVCLKAMGYAVRIKLKPMRLRDKNE